MRCAIYARRSTDEHQAASLDVQLEEARRFIAAKGWTCEPEHVYIEDAVSRAEFKKRPELIRVLNAAESKAFDVLVTRDETRLGGDMNRTTLWIQDLLDAGVQLHYYVSGERVELNNATAKLLAMVKNYTAEIEREKISSRTHEHLLNKARRGLNVGGRCYGYDNVEQRDGDRRVHVEYSINAEQAEIVRGIFASYAAGEGLRTIVKGLNARGVSAPSAGKRGTGSWSTSAVHAMLRRERYRGAIVWNRREKTYRKGTKVRIERGAHDWLRVDMPSHRIIDDEAWFAVQKRLAANVTGGAKAGGRPPRYLLSGIARCGECGGPLTAINGKFGNETVKAYTCAYHRDRGEDVCGSALRRPVESLNGAIVEWVRDNVLSEELVLATLKRVRERLSERAEVTTSELPGLQAQAQKLRAEIDRLVEAIATANSKPAALVSAIADRQERLSDLEARMRAAQAAPGAISLEIRRLELETRKRIDNLRAVLERNPEEARALMLSVFEGPLVCTPIETSAGKRFQIEGNAVIGRIFAGEAGVSNSASPRGFEPLLQP
ncbi:MAG: recombinase family protein [Myxococcales bacterium]